MISDEDLSLFNTKEGLWFLNDEGQPVEATLDMPSTLNFEPLVSMHDHVLFYLYTRTHSEQAIYLDDIESLKKSNFNASRETKFVTHGWVNSRKSKACTIVKDGNIFYIYYLH